MHSSNIFGLRTSRPDLYRESVDFPHYARTPMSDARPNIKHNLGPRRKVDPDRW